MEKHVLKGRVVLCLCVYLNLPLGTNTEGQSGFDTSKTYTYNNGTELHVCLMCPPGMFRTKHCTSIRSVDHCQTCPERYFKWSYDQATSCEKCKPHCYDRNEDLVGPCSLTNDTMCVCKAGFYRHKEGSCFPHKECPEGEGVEQKGSNSSDTTCAACVTGKTYSDVSSSSELCIECSRPSCNSTTTLINCSASHNYVCSTDDQNKQPPQTESHMPGWAIALIVLLIVIVLILVLVAMAGYFRRRNKKRKALNERTNRVVDPSRVPLVEQSGPPQEENTRNKLFHFIAKDTPVGEWRFYILGIPGNCVTNEELERIIVDNRSSVSTQIYESLQKHAQKNPHANLEIYIEALRACHLNATADKVEKSIHMLVTAEQNGDVSCASAQNHTIHFSNANQEGDVEIK